MAVVVTVLLVLVLVAVAAFRPTARQRCFRAPAPLLTVTALPLRCTPSSSPPADTDDLVWDPKAAPKLDFDECYYSVLEVDAAIAPRDLKKAYFRVVFSYHPDRKTTAADKRLANQQMMVINGAYRVLKTPETRYAYDSQRRRGLFGANAGVKGSGRNPSQDSRQRGPSPPPPPSSEVDDNFKSDRYYQELWNRRRAAEAAAGGARPRWRRLDDDVSVDDILGNDPQRNASYRSSVAFYDPRPPQAGSFADAFARADAVPPAWPPSSVRRWRTRNGWGEPIPSSADTKEGTGGGLWDTMDDFDESFVRVSGRDRRRRRREMLENGFIFVTGDDEEFDDEEEEEEDGGEMDEEGVGNEEADDDDLVDALLKQVQAGQSAVDDFFSDAYDQLEREAVKSGVEGEVAVGLRVLLGLLKRDNTKKENETDNDRTE